MRDSYCSMRERRDRRALLATECGSGQVFAAAMLAVGLVCSVAFYRAILALEVPSPRATLLLPDRFEGCLTYQGRALGPLAGEILGWDSPAVRVTAVLYEGDVPRVFRASFRFNRLNQLVRFEGRSEDAGVDLPFTAEGLNPLRVSAGGRVLQLPGPLLLLPVPGTDVRTLHYPALERELLFSNELSPIRRFAVVQTCDKTDPTALREARDLLTKMIEELK